MAGGGGLGLDGPLAPRHLRRTSHPPIPHPALRLPPVVRCHALPRSYHRPLPVSTPQPHSAFLRVLLTDIPMSLSHGAVRCRSWTWCPRTFTTSAPSSSGARWVHKSHTHAYTKHPRSSAAYTKRSPFPPPSEHIQSHRTNLAARRGPRAVVLQVGRGPGGASGWVLEIALVNLIE